MSDKSKAVAPTKVKGDKIKIISDQKRLTDLIKGLNTVECFLLMKQIKGFVPNTTSEIVEVHESLKKKIDNTCYA